MLSIFCKRIARKQLLPVKDVDKKQGQAKPWSAVYGWQDNLSGKTILRLRRIAVFNCWLRPHWHQYLMGSGQRKITSKLYICIIQEVTHFIYLQNTFLFTSGIVLISMNSFIDLGKGPFSKKVSHIDQQRTLEDKYVKLTKSHKDCPSEEFLVPELLLIN